jgi:hypothetical protein
MRLAAVFVHNQPQAMSMPASDLPLTGLHCSPCLPRPCKIRHTCIYIHTVYLLQGVLTRFALRPLSDEQELMELISRPEESLEFDSVRTHT